MVIDYSFQAMTTVLCSTERASVTTGFAENLTGLYCTPPAPVDGETVTRLMIDTPTKTWEVHLQDDPDIKQGDRLVIGSVKYNIKYVEPFKWLPNSDTRLRLIIEDLRNP